MTRALLSQVPACLAAASALLYFGCSEGIRNHVLLLARAARTLAERLA